MTSIGHNGDIFDGADEKAGNWFAVSRRTFQHHMVGIHNRAYTDFEAWLSLLAMASYSTRKVSNKGQIIVLDPGDLMASHGYLAERWMWSVDKVRWYLKRLALEAMITKHPAVASTKRNTNQIQVLTICNYDVYQFYGMRQHQATPQLEYQASTTPTPAEPQANTENLTNKQINNIPPTPWAKRERTPEEIAEADRIAAEALALGARIKGGAVAKSGRATVRTKGELDGNRGILIDETGKLSFVNCKGSELLKALVVDFPGVNIDAACNRAGVDIAKMSYPSVQDAMTAIRKQAQYIAEDLAKSRGGKVSRGAATTEPFENPTERRKRLLAQISSEGGKQ